jgi:tetratricopeptide (TPR) repeat protein
VATVLNNLAKVLRDTNRPAEAETLFNRALAIDQTSFGPMHPVVARDLKNLSKFFKIWNRSADAEPLMQRVIDILQDMERQSGSSVSELGPAFNFQAQLLTETNQLADAENCYRKALVLDEKNYGLRSAPVEKDLRGLAQLLQATQRPHEAASLFSRADEIAALAKRGNDAADRKAAQKCLGDACGSSAEEGI